MVRLPMSGYRKVKKGPKNAFTPQEGMLHLFATAAEGNKKRQRSKAVPVNKKLP